MKISVQKLAWRGILVLILAGMFWLFKMLPGWIIEREMQKQLSRIPPARKTVHDPAVSSPVPQDQEIKSKAPSRERIKVTEEEIRNGLHAVRDPEIDIDVVDLGLIREIRIDEREIEVTMILTTRFCPYQGAIVKSVREAVKKITGEENVKIIVDYSRNWSFSDLTPEGKKQWEQIFKNGSVK